MVLTLLWLRIFPVAVSFARHYPRPGRIPQAATSSRPLSLRSSAQAEACWRLGPVPSALNSQPSTINCFRPLSGTPAAIPVAG